MTIPETIATVYAINAAIFAILTFVWGASFGIYLASGRISNESDKGDLKQFSLGVLALSFILLAMSVSELV